MALLEQLENQHLALLQEPPAVSCNQQSGCEGINILQDWHLLHLEMLIGDKYSIHISSCHKQDFFGSRFQADKTGTYLQHTTNCLQEKIYK